MGTIQIEPQTVSGKHKHIDQQERRHGDNKEWGEDSSFAMTMTEPEQWGRKCGKETMGHGWEGMVYRPRD